MKVLFVNRMMGVAWGGGENFDYHLARGLQARGHEVVMLTGVCADRPALAPEGVECIPVVTPYLRRYMYQWAGRVPVAPGLAAELDLKLFVDKAKPLIRALAVQRGIDVVQVLALPYLAKWLSGWTRSAMRFPGPPAWFQNGLLRRLSAHSRIALFTHGDAVRHFHEQVGAPVHEVSPGVDRAVFRQPRLAERLGARQRFGFGERDFVAVTVGRLVPGKGHECAIRGLALGLQMAPAAPLRLLIVGDGPLRGRLQTLAAELGRGPQVHFAGAMDRAGVASSLWAADAFCLLSSYENYSNAALEAMASGLPVIASRVGGFPRQVDDGKNGFLVEAGDAEHLARRLVELASSRDLAGALGESAKAFASGFSWSATAARVEELYAHIEP